MNQGFDTVAQGFDAADNAAFAAITEANKPAAVETTETSNTAAAPAQVAAEVVPPVAVAPTLASLKDDDLVEIEVGGKLQRLPWKEARASVMMHQDYTRKTQEVASARKELETIYTQMQERESKIASFLKDDKAVEQYLLQIRNQQINANPNIDPNNLASVQDVRNLLQQEIAASQKQIDQMVSSKVQELAISQSATAIKGDLDKTIEALKTEYPALKAIQGIDAILYNTVTAMNPSSPSEAKQFFMNAAKAQVEALEAHYVNQQKAAEVAKTKLVKQGIEPSGPGILPKPKNIKSFDDKDHEKDVIAQIEALMRS